MRLSLVVATTVVTGMAVAGPAAAAPAAGNSSSVASQAIEAASAGDAVAYWTPDRMRSATPYDALRATPAESVRTAPAPSAGPAAAPFTVPPTAGSVSAGPTATAAGATSRPYTDLPDRLNVKIFFTGARGGNYVCSGTIVNSVSKRMVSTAGHCVSDGAGRYHRNVVVVPAYSSRSAGSGDAPYGKWPARLLTTRTEWHKSSAWEQDVAFIVTSDVGGQRIAKQLGGHGVKFNISRSQQFRSYGYPQTAPFTGFNQHVCASGRMADDDPTSRSGPLTIRISCGMTNGASGGGWIIGQTAGLGFVNGVNSYKYVAGPLTNAGHMYGPYFGPQAKSLYEFAARQG